MSEKVAARQDLDTAIEQASAAIGPLAELERTFYRDYLANRYWLGCIDREWFLRPETLTLRLGAIALAIGLGFHTLTPSLATFVRFRTGLEQAARSTASSTLPWLETLAPASPTPPIFSWLDGGWGFVVLIALGLMAFAVASVRILIRVRLAPGTTAARAGLWAALPVIAPLFVVSLRAGDYATALSTQLLRTEVSAFAAAARPLEISFLVGAGLMTLLVIGSGALLLRASRRGLADSAPIRPALAALTLLAVGSLLTTHPILTLTLLASKPDAAGELPFGPAELAGRLSWDFALFLVGMMVVLGGVFWLKRQLEEIERILQGRSVDLG